MYPLCDYFFWREEGVGGGGGEKRKLIIKCDKNGKKAIGEC